MLVGILIQSSAIRRSGEKYQELKILGFCEMTQEERWKGKIRNNEKMERCKDEKCENLEEKKE